MGQRRSALFGLAVLAAGVLAGCTQAPSWLERAPTQPGATEPTVTVVPASYRQLQGWDTDRHGDALAAFQKSCVKLLARAANKAVADNPAAPGGLAGDWHAPCRAAQDLDVQDHARARQYFEEWFAPYAVRDVAAGGDGGIGLFTGYYVPELNGTWVRGGAYQTPLLARPDDLVSASLGQFDDELGGNTVWGRVQNGRLQPYPDRRAIETGALGEGARPILWVDSSVDAFFLHIQGSGQVRLADGTVRHVGFAGKNGRPYKSIGRILIDRGEISADRLTMDSIRAWIDARPEEGADLMRQNPSYVFFRLLDGEGPLGAQSVALTAERSLAVDRRFMPLGAPVWMEVNDPLDATKPFNRLMVAQDTGGAIKGVVRGDIFFGAGDLAAKRAGNMKRPGQYFILLPRPPAS